jgi:non-ribosomal peptide synthetase component F
LFGIDASPSLALASHYPLDDRRKQSRMSGFQEFPPAAVEQTLAARFATIVARHPGRVAVAGRDLSLTYAELDGASSALAGALLDRGGEGRQPFALLLDQPGLRAGIPRGGQGRRDRRSTRSHASA